MNHHIDNFLVIVFQWIYSDYLFRPSILLIFIYLIKEPVLDIPIDLECSIETETDDVPQTLLSVESSKNGSQSLPTSPHELAASLLSKNSVMKRRKKKSHLDKPDDDLEDEDHDGDEDEAKSTCSTKTLMNQWMNIWRKIEQLRCLRRSELELFVQSQAALWQQSRLAWIPCLGSLSPSHGSGTEVRRNGHYATFQPLLWLQLVRVFYSWRTPTHTFKSFDDLHTATTLK